MGILSNVVDYLNPSTPFEPLPAPEPITEEDLEDIPAAEPSAEWALQGQFRSFEAYRPEIDKLFFDYPDKVLSWRGDAFDNVIVNIPAKGKRRFWPIEGHIEFDEKDKISRWTANSHLSCTELLVFERISDTLEQEAMIAAVKAILVDNESVRKYGDLFAATLLENETAVYNAAEAFYGDTRMSDKKKQNKFSERFYSDEWLEAWQKAISEEFNASAEILPDPGCFRLKAL